jgi:hypothetical protein
MVQADPCFIPVSPARLLSDKVLSRCDFAFSHTCGSFSRGLLPLLGALDAVSTATPNYRSLRLVWQSVARSAGVLITRTGAYLVTAK